MNNITVNNENENFFSSRGMLYIPELHKLFPRPQNVNSRQTWYEWRNNKVDEYKNDEQRKEISKILKEKGISNINGDLIMVNRGVGPTEKPNPNPAPNDPAPRIIKYANLEDSTTFDYNKCFNSDIVPNKKLSNKLWHIRWDREFWDPVYIRQLEDIQERYNQDKKNGTLSKIENLSLRIAAYLDEIHLKTGKNFIDAGVPCNLCFMISRYINKGELDTDIEWINDMTLNQMNSFDNLYIVYLMYNVFTFKSKPHVMMYKGKQVEGKERWQICKGRCRYSPKNYRTTCRLPRFTFDKNTGTIILQRLCSDIRQPNTKAIQDIYL